MGDFISKSDGIVDHGFIGVAKCIDCNKTFNRKEGVVTIKGPSHPIERCVECNRLYNNEDSKFENIKNQFFGGEKDKHRAAIRKVKFTHYIDGIKLLPKNVEKANRYVIHICPECEENFKNIYPVEFSDHTPFNVNTLRI
jgi:predicted RNA-binding Zn-ribbon protein involved in translation (DUF1610 family)